MSPPDFGVTFDDLSVPAKDRHELLVDLFGQYIFWIRRQSRSRIAGLVKDSSKREQLGNYFKEVFDKIAELNDQDQDAALELADSAVADFTGMLLTMLGGEGFDDRLGADHAFRFRLDLEIIDANNGDVVDTETINRGGEKFFAEYWGRWLNRYGKIR